MPGRNLASAERLFNLKGIAIRLSKHVISLYHYAIMLSPQLSVYVFVSGYSLNIYAVILFQYFSSWL